MSDIVQIKLIGGDIAVGRYCGLEVIYDTKCNYINITKLCTSFGRSQKHAVDWFNNKRTRDTIESIMSLVDPSSIVTTDSKSWHAQLGATFVLRTPIAGTYMHPKIVPLYAFWLSPEYYLKVVDFIQQMEMSSLQYKLNEKLEIVNHLGEIINEDKILANKFNDQLTERTYGVFMFWHKIEDGKMHYVIRKQNEKDAAFKSRLEKYNKELPDYTYCQIKCLTSIDTLNKIKNDSFLMRLNDNKKLTQKGCLTLPEDKNLAEYIINLMNIYEKNALDLEHEKSKL